MLPHSFHMLLPGYRPTPLTSADRLAKKVGVKSVWVKEESTRLGLPAFKILGASWAVYRYFYERFGDVVQGAVTLRDLGERIRPHGRWRLVTATDGNHGRGVARVAKWLGIEAEVFVPEGTKAARIKAIESEGATVRTVQGTYEDAVRKATSLDSDTTILIQDSGFGDYETIPNWIAEGYLTLFWEMNRQLTERAASRPTVVFVQIGVGALAEAAVRHFKGSDPAGAPYLIGVEPEEAACAKWALDAGEIVTRKVGADASIMAGLNCGTVSETSWPYLRDGLRAIVTVDDARAREAMRLLARDKIVAGESGAAGAAGLLEVASDKKTRADYGVDRDATVLLISTEGDTDREAYQEIVGKSADEIRGD